MTRDLLFDMRRFGNLARRSQLVELGYTVRQIRNAMTDEQLTIVRRPWLAARAAHPEAVRAVRLGGKLAAASALRSYGVWVSRNSGLWVQASSQSSRLPPVRRGEHRITAPEWFEHVTDVQWRVSVPDALVQAIRNEETPDAIASLESARYQGLIDDALVRDIANLVPHRKRRTLERSRRGAMSGIETLFRLAAEAQGWRVDIQVFIRGVGHVDVLIDGWLVIELDGGTHADINQMHVDRQRDTELILLGYRYHRFDHPQLMGSMDRCIEVVRLILAHGRPVGR
ncbi:very-short-patch-repair endonuclease [Mycetocola sp. CAN_C7]|uniref:endonuclease domain-containing protein n=1 Tax=Mycetocola sp. CAN_C7 TaxID=2787724 RepID=UPI0018C92FF8